MDSSPNDEVPLGTARTSAAGISPPEGEKQRSAHAGKASQKDVEERLGKHRLNLSLQQYFCIWRKTDLR